MPRLVSSARAQGVILIALAGTFLTQTSQGPVAYADSSMLTMCSAPKVVRAPIRAGARSFKLSVPDVRSENLDVPTIRLAEGEEVEVLLTSSAKGMAAVHGLTEEIAVVAGGTTAMPVAATQTGRFPLHFHGVDGSHTPVATVEVWPRD